MTNTQNLQSFIDEHERKLDAKVEATAAVGRLGVNYRHLAGDRAFSPISPQHYRAILGRRSNHHAEGRTWPMRYELVPR